MVMIIIEPNPFPGPYTIINPPAGLAGTAISVDSLFTPITSLAAGSDGPWAMTGNEDTITLSQGLIDAGAQVTYLSAQGEG